MDNNKAFLNANKHCLCLGNPLCDRHLRENTCSFTCSTLPPSYQYTCQLISRRKDIILALLASFSLESQNLVVLTYNQLSSEKIQQQLIYNVILEILSHYSSEEQIPEDDINRILFLITLCPSCCKIKDEGGLLLIHHLSLYESRSYELMKAVIDCFPQGISEYAIIGYIEAIPLHLILLKNESDFQLAYYMLEASPLSAR
jgi:hypothetical protein